MNFLDGPKTKPAPPPPAPAPASAPKAAPAPAPAPQPSSTSSFRPAPAAAPPVRLTPPTPPATTLSTERLGDGQANCLERAVQLSRPNDTIVLCSDRNDASGHAVVQHDNGSVTDPNQPAITYPDLGSWQATHPQYQVQARVPASDAKDVLSLPPGPARDAKIQQLGLGGAAQVAVADDGGETPEPEYRLLNDGLNLRESADPNAAALLPDPMPAGATVQVLEHGTGDQADWARVQYVDAEGASHEGWAKIDGTNGDGSAFSRAIPASDVQQLQDARGLYINQFYADDDVGGDRANANCGPTSLAVAFQQQGLELPEVSGLQNDGTAGDRVYRARFAMYGDYPAGDEHNDVAQPNADMDGVTPAQQDGQFTYDTGTEASTLTGMEHMERAVDAAGGSATRIDATTDAIGNELDAGRTVIVAGTFDDPASTANPPARKTDLWSADDSVHAHIVAVTGRTSDGNFIVCDPANMQQQPVIVTPEQLASFMNGNAVQPLSVGG